MRLMLRTGYWRPCSNSQVLQHTQSSVVTPFWAFLLSDGQIEALAGAIEPFLDTRPPEPDCWEELDDNELWMCVIGQVCVVSRAEGSDRVMQDPLAQQELAWDELIGLEDDEALQIIWAAFRRNGVRYVAGELEKDNKSKALVRNMRVLEEYGGP